jgi:hypothetical protein
MHRRQEGTVNDQPGSASRSMAERTQFRLTYRYAAPCNRYAVDDDRSGWPTNAHRAVAWDLAQEVTHGDVERVDASAAAQAARFWSSGRNSYTPAERIDKSNGACPPECLHRIFDRESCHC